jgi:hypothetical protein
MSQARLWAFLGVALPVLAGTLGQISTIDLSYHLRIGHDILSGAGIPQTDTMTFTTFGAPWRDQQWAAEVVLALVNGAGSWLGLILLRAALYGLIFGALMLTIARAGAPMRVAALVTIAAFVVSTEALALRPQLIAMALFTLTLLALGERHRHPRLLWAVPVLALLWANVHGTFFLAPAAAAVVWLDDVVSHRAGANRMLVVALASGVAPFINPLGPSVYGYVASISTNPLVSARIEEWTPTTIRTAPGALFFASAIAVAGLLAARGSRLAWPTLAWLAGLFVLGVFAVRGIALWSIGAVAAVAPLLTASPGVREAPEEREATEATRRAARISGRLNALVALVIVGLGIVLLPVWRAQDPLVGPVGVVRQAPSALTQQLRPMVRPGDRIFVPEEWGSWLEYAVPNGLVFVDSRLELFPESAWLEYDAVLAGYGGWQQVLDTYGVRFVVVPINRPDLRDRLTASGWNQSVDTADGWVFVRG